MPSSDDTHQFWNTNATFNFCKLQNTQTHRSRNRPGISLAPLRAKPQSVYISLFNLSYPDLPRTSSFPSSLAVPLSLLFLSDGGERWDSWPAGPPPHPEGGRHPPLFSCASLSQYPALLTVSTPHISEWSQMIQHTVGRVTDTARAGRRSKTDWEEREMSQNSFQSSPAYWCSCNPQKRPALFFLKLKRDTAALVADAATVSLQDCLSFSLSLSLPLSLSLSHSQALIEKVPQTDKCTETLPHMHTVLPFPTEIFSMKTSKVSQQINRHHDSYRTQNGRIKWTGKRWIIAHPM